MRIAFFCGFFPNPTSGGISAVTNALAGQFIAMGHSCYVIYIDNPDVSEVAYTDTLRTSLKRSSRSNVRSFILDNKIDVIINQHSRSSWVTSFFGANVLGTGAKLYSVFHWSPHWEETDLSANTRMKRPQGVLQRIIRSAKLAVYPSFSVYVRKMAPRQNIKALRESHRFVVLSQRTKSSFITAYKIPKELEHKIAVINNPLCLPSTLAPEQIADKQQEVLIVSRLEERHKRISLALRVWQKIEQSGVDDWRLRIVGRGSMEQTYKQMVQEMGLRNVTFEGRQEPLEYYRRASIYMMTSSSEGWPITLMESLQSGVVPLVFDAFPTLSDIITDGYNGIIVANNDIDTFAVKALDLMRDHHKRRAMAANAIESSEKFSVDKIASGWIDLFSE